MGNHNAHSTDLSARLGQLTYDLISAAEARLYGLRKEVIQVDGKATTFYRSKGRGEPILMLHGVSADKEVWARFARHFASRHQVIIPDMLGHGETGFSRAWSYSPTSQASHLVGLLNALNVDKTHVIGNSMGGYIAACLAAQHPDRVLSATFVNPGGLKQPRISELDQAMSKGQNPFLIDSREGFARFYPMTMASPPWMPGFVLNAIADHYIERRTELSVIFPQVHRFDELPSLLPQVKAPALVMWGKADRLIDVSAAPLWQAALPNAQLEVMDGAGHMPMVERPGPVAAIYRQFLSALPVRSCKT